MHMTEEVNESVEETLQGVAPADESTSEHDNVSEQQRNDEAPKRKDAEYNFAELRRQVRELQEENERVRKQNQPQPDYGVQEDDLIEGKHFIQLKKELEEMKSSWKQKELATVDERLKARFPDFSQVVSRENIEYLNNNHPEMAEALASYNDPYKKAVAAYEYMKLVAPSPQVYEEKKKAEENMKKPVSVNAVNKQSVLGDAKAFENGLTLTPEAQKHYWREMNEAISGA